jgi:hypothetical protein
VWRSGEGCIASALLPGLGDTVGASAHTGVMTAPQPGRPRVLDRPACTPAAIRAVLAANAGAEVLARYDRELDAAFEQARQDQDLTALVRTVRRWWFEAEAWRDPVAQREFLARMDRYAADGPPPADRRVTREEIRARHGV